MYSRTFCANQPSFAVMAQTMRWHSSFSRVSHTTANSVSIKECGTTSRSSSQGGMPFRDTSLKRWSGPFFYRRWPLPATSLNQERSHAVGLCGIRPLIAPSRLAIRERSRGRVRLQHASYRPSAFAVARTLETSTKIRNVPRSETVVRCIHRLSGAIELSRTPITVRMTACVTQFEAT